MKEDNKPTKETIYLTTKDREIMERYIAQWASGIGLRHKLRETYKVAFKAGQENQKGKKDATTEIK